MDKYTVKKVESLTTSKNNPYKKVDLEKSDGSLITGVSAFSFKYPALDTLVEGAVITASVVIDGNYKNLVGVPEKKPNNFKQVMVEKTMERKEQSISKFQDSKEYSIKVASTFSNAVNLAIANFKQNPSSLRTLEEEVEYWREWCWTHYDVQATDYPPF